MTEQKINNLKKKIIKLAEKNNPQDVNRFIANLFKALGIGKIADVNLTKNEVLTTKNKTIKCEDL